MNKKKTKKQSYYRKKNQNKYENIIQNNEQENDEQENNKLRKENKQDKEENKSHKEDNKLNKENKPDKQNNTDEVDKAMKDLIKGFDLMWKRRKLLKDNKEFAELKDEKQIIYFEQMGFTTLIKDHPIVSKYLICMGLFNTDALKKYLLKIKNTQLLDPDKRAKGYMEEQWCARSADYVMYLWITYRKGKHYNMEDAKLIWEETYTKLKDEFSDFRDKHKDAEKTVKENRKKYDAQNLDELVGRISSGVQKLPKKDVYELTLNLDNKAIVRKYRNCMAELLRNVEPCPECCFGVGKGKLEPVKDPNKPTITMIETVDEKQMDNIPAEYKAPVSDQMVKDILQSGNV